MKIKILTASLLILFSTSLAFAQNTAVLNFDTSSDNYEVGQTISLKIVVNPNGATFDTITASAVFPSDLVEVQNFALNPSFTATSPDNYFDNERGILHYSAGIPGSTNESTIFGTITFKVKKAGSATVSLTSDSTVLNGGENIGLQKQYDTTFKLTDATPPLQQKPVVEKKPVVKPKLAAKETEPKTLAVKQEQKDLAENISPQSIPLAASAIPVVGSNNHRDTNSSYIVLLVWSAIFMILLAFIILIFRHFEKKESNKKL
jgi:hypothetical protein